MINLIKKYLSRKNTLSKYWSIAIIVIGLLGLTDSGYLVFKHYSNQVLPCPTVESVNTCQVVASSVYSNILGIPIALIGFCFYVAIIIIGVVGLKRDYQYIFNFIPPLSALAWLFSARLTYLQFFVIHSICYYCIFSAFLATLLLIIGVIIIKKNQ